MKHHYEALKAYYKELQVEMGKLEEKKNVKEEGEEEEGNTTLSENEAPDIDDVMPPLSSLPQEE